MTDTPDIRVEFVLAGRYEEVDTGYETPCHLWTGALQSKGYPSVGLGRKKTGLVHRLVYEAHHGPQPPTAHVHHMCERKTCIRLSHLSDRSPKAHAQEHSKLCLEQVWTIKATHRAGTHKLQEIAKSLDVSRVTVENIVKGRRWSDAVPPEHHPPLPPETGTGTATLQRLTIQQVADIKGRPDTGRGHQARLAREFGCSGVAINAILNGRTHKTVEPAR